MSGKSDAIDTLGSIIGPGYGRDAVHVAVIPAVAAKMLFPGQHVGFVDNLNHASECDNPLGIVDPFLKQNVQPGQTFWLMLYPRTITSLRHVWSHPDVSDEQGIGESKSRWTKEESEAWLRDFCANSDCPGYDTTIAAASEEMPYHVSGYGNSWEKESESLIFNGSDAHGTIPDAFWDHLENLKGRKFERSKYFSCSC